MNSDPIIARHEGSVSTIELNRPDCGNLVTMEMVTALAAAFRSVPATAKLIVVTGRGADFCKGRDYQGAPESAQGGRTPTALEVLEKFSKPVSDLYGMVKALPVPSLAIVQGAAYGFGCALACGCDIVLAGEGSRFRFPEMKRGLPPTLAMFAVMDRVNPRALSYLVYSAAEVGARAALDLGLASAVFPDANLTREAQAVIDAVSAYPADAVRAVQQYLRSAPLMEPRGRAEYGAGLFANVLSSR
jgi:enoyl-CoA hydratase/carnithine racemase